LKAGLGIWPFATRSHATAVPSRNQLVEWHIRNKGLTTPSYTYTHSWIRRRNIKGAPLTRRVKIDNARSKQCASHYAATIIIPVN